MPKFTCSWSPIQPQQQVQVERTPTLCLYRAHVAFNSFKDAFFSDKYSVLPFQNPKQAFKYGLDHKVKQVCGCIRIGCHVHSPISAVWACHVTKVVEVNVSSCQY